METVYRSFDGKEFKTKYDCEKYEILGCIRNKPYSMFADKDGTEISLDDFDSFRDCVTNVYYIVCRDYCDYLDVAAAFNYFKCTYPEWGGQRDVDNSIPHIWWWSNHFDRWVDMKDRLGELEKQKTIYEKLIGASEVD